MTSLDFNGLLYFPLTPFDSDGAVDLDGYSAHVTDRLDHRPGGIFPACGTGELHALSVKESAAIVETTVSIVNGRIPVVAGTGGSVADAQERAAASADAGADALLILPPYLVTGPEAGIERYVRAILAATDLPVIVYNRGTARYSPDLIGRLADDPRVIGYKDGVGDVASVQETVLSASRTGRKDFHFFNGLLTAELSQGAYRGIGVPLYSSAVFSMAPEIANAHYAAYIQGDEERRLQLLDTFYRPLVRLRDEVPGFGVSLIKAGARLRGEAMGSVRPPLVDPDERQTDELSAIIRAGEELISQWTL